MYPNCAALEMETHTLFALAKMSKTPIYAAGAAIGLIDRDRANYKLPSSRQKELEDLGGYAMLRALAEFEFPGGEPEFTIEMRNVLKQRVNPTKTEGING
jgi:hypothetical protein